MTRKTELLDTAAMKAAVAEASELTHQFNAGRCDDKDKAFTRRLEKAQRRVSFAQPTTLDALKAQLGYFVFMCGQTDDDFTKWYGGTAGFIRRIAKSIDTLTTTAPDPLAAMWAEYQALGKLMEARKDKDADADTHPAYARWSELFDLIHSTDAKTAGGLAIKVEHLTAMLRHSMFADAEHRDKVFDSLRRSAAIVAGKEVRK